MLTRFLFLSSFLFILGLNVFITKDFSVAVGTRGPKTSSRFVNAGVVAAEDGASGGANGDANGAVPPTFLP